jgi:hypothetical protein
VEEPEARHIRDIIRERGNIFQRRVGDLSARLGASSILGFQKPLRSLFGVVLNVLATIGWFVTRPFIIDDGGTLTARKQSRG